MDWVSVAEYPDSTSAAFMAGRFYSEGIPASSDGLSRSNAGPYCVFVPRSLKRKAEDILKQPPISDDELTELALSQPSEDIDVK
jgi:hypothetical protein